ncbi:hypothetical protein HP439_03235 [Sphingobacterium shayense]|uniref:FKBP-type peptidyl-prolyl cis-trans isomerase n=1 Tax=Sphingobacterium shayense TaxID=626343 RepID=UPI001553BFC1|nr:hypothetical protein [Sphingobacterium shayense]NQD69734.1 hypothetical protein [Sphingobacterium shayense]
MKNLIKPFFALALAAVTFTSCMKDNDPIDNTEQYRKIEERVDSVLTSQKTQIEAFANSEFENPIKDSIKITLSYLDKTVERGIWYEVTSEPTDDSYEYEISGQNLVYPSVKVKYSVKSLTGTTYKEDATGSTYVLGGSNANANIINQIWGISFFPYSIDYNGQTYYPKGLTKEGLKTGSKIRVVAPSVWAFDTQNVGDIPANTPLVYEFEVLDID